MCLNYLELFESFEFAAETAAASAAAAAFPNNGRKAPAVEKGSLGSKG